MKRLLSYKKNELGLSTIWVLLSLGALFAVLALALDITHLVIVKRQLQSAGDAASLAAARELNGTAAGWQRAKRAAMAALRAQYISGTGSLQNIDAMVEGTGDPMEGTFSQYRGNEIRDQGLHVTLERGVYWANRHDDPNDNEPLRFYSFEEGAETVSLARPVIDMRGKPLSQVSAMHNLPVFHMAGAIRVKIEMTGIRTWFGHLIGARELRTETSSIAASNTSPSLPVAPFAIPACALLLDTDTTHDGMYEVNDYDGDRQCGRELVFTEANPLSEANRPRRIEGIIRSSTYPRKDNIRQVPITGVLGIPSNDWTAGKAGPQDVSNWIGGLGSNPEAVLGMRFRPLEDGVSLFDGWGNNIAMNLDAKILNFGTPFASVFGEPGGGLREEAARPRRFRTYSEAWAKFSWMRFLMDYVDGNVNLQNVETEIGGEEYMNPLCESDSLNFGEELEDRVPLNQRNVLPVYAMVVAPGVDRLDLGPTTIDVRYCDYNSQFAHASRDSEPPLADTSPIVVGFVKAYIIDYNFKNFRNSVLPERLNDNNPRRIGFGSIIPALEKFDEHPDTYKDCLLECQKQEACSAQCKEQIIPPQLDEGTIVTSDFYNAERACYVLPDYEVTLGCYNFLFGKCDHLQNPLELLLCWANRIASIPSCLILFFEVVAGQNSGDDRTDGWKCLPQLKDDVSMCHNYGDARDQVCYDPPRHKRAQYGCGGVRARLSCEGTQLLSPFPANTTRPILVK